jgi:hypothetical protein
MRALLIDPEHRSITEIAIGGDLESLCSVLRLPDH